MLTGPLGLYLRLDGRSRMSGDAHVRFCERLAVRFRRPTHLVILTCGHAEEARIWTGKVMTCLGLTLNEAKTNTPFTFCRSRATLFFDGLAPKYQ